MSKMIITDLMTLVAAAVGADDAWRAEYVARLKKAGDDKAKKATIRNEAWVAIMARRLAQNAAGATLTGRVTKAHFDEALAILSKSDITAKVNARTASEHALYNLAKKTWSVMLQRAGVEAVQKRAPSPAGSGKGKKAPAPVAASPAANQSTGAPVANDAKVISAPVADKEIIGPRVNVAPAPATAPLVLPAFRDADELVMFMLSEATRLRQLFAKNKDCGRGDKRADHVRKASEAFLSAMAKVPAKG